MGAVDNQINWRKVFQDTPGDLKVTTTPDPDAEQPVVQLDRNKLLCTSTPDQTAEQPVRQFEAARLKCTNTPDGITEQPVTQATPASLKCTNTPDGTTAQPVSQVSGVHGIWPAPNSLRISKTGSALGVAIRTIYTVPANKKLFISSGLLASRLSADAATYCLLFVENAAGAPLFYLNWHYYDVAGHQTIPTQYSPALEAVATDIVKAQSLHANLDCRGFFDGWLEDA
ncbi:MAG TPA: hypothetical protein ENH62_10720 [Marinobacter sp.]|uniref:Uncharacterized protein n=1 Tax=marine sediment metagenome TaxID=412755 RepID=A0A0F9N0E9_9ZZZZ|nr:hypothetical protein [Marinobacter sp.]